MSWTDNPQRWRIRQEMVDAIAALDIDEMYRLFELGAVLDDVQRAITDTQRTPGEVLAAMDDWLTHTTVENATIACMRIAIAQPPLEGVA